jgi:N-acetylglucosamine kinase-like BadF-type ATPase
MSKYLLAVDGGGTKTDAICADEKGAIIGRGLAGPTNLTSTSVGAASFNLIEAIRQAIETLPEHNRAGFSVLVMGLAGLDSQKEYDEAFDIFGRAVAHYQIEKFVLVNDSIIALKNGTDLENAAVLICGTGSTCYGKKIGGQEAKTSGMDYLLTDQGSGYDIGRRVLREAVKSYDGRSPKSVLEGMVCEHFKIATVSELKNVVYHPPLTKIEVAELAPLCSKAFDQGDRVAHEIFDKVIGDILIMVRTVVHKLDFDQFDLVCSGSVIAIPYIFEAISANIKSEFPQVNIIIPQKEPVFGALKIAMKEVA